MATSPEKKCRWGVYGKLIKDGSGNFTLGPAFPEHNPKYCLGLDASVCPSFADDTHWLTNRSF